MPSEFGSRRLGAGNRAIALFYVAMATAAAFVGASFIGASAAAQDPFSRLVGPAKAARFTDAVGQVQRFVTATDENIFLLEDNGIEARIRFLCGADDPRIECRIDDAYPAEEIIVLRASRAPRGDAVYRDETGATVLRVTPYGGATVRWPGATRATAAVKSFGQDAPLSLTPTPLPAAEARAQTATALVSAVTGAPIVFDVGAPSYGAGLDEVAEAAVLADAVTVAAKGVAAVASDPTGARVVARRIRRIAFAPAGAADVALEETTLTVFYAASRGLSGRPASAAVSAYLEDRL